MMAPYLISLFLFSIFLHSLINAQYTLDPCRCDAECSGPRVCMRLVPPFDFTPCQPGDEGCTCALNSEVSGDSLGISSCTFDFDCFEGDICEDTPTFTDETLRTCVTSCGNNRENCPEPFERPECDVTTIPETPTVTPTPSKKPKPSKTPSQSPIPPLPPAPSVSPNPTLLLPMETPGPSPDLDLLPSMEAPGSSPDLDLPSSMEPPGPSPDLDMQPPEPTMLATPSQPKPTDEGIGMGLTRDPCTTLADCMAPRRCIKVNSPLLDCEPGDEECDCIPLRPPVCESDADCEVEGEQCFDGSNGRPGTGDIGRLCVSSCSIYKEQDPEKFAAMCEPPVEATMEEFPSPAPTEESPSPAPTDAICVAAEHLEGVEKVFDRDFHAWVLCDTGGSCATPGHMVVWNGEGMMMKSYCDAVGCERKVMAVNSPRWRAGAVPSKTDGLVYTSFAARFATSAEERVLAAIVRLVV